MELKHRTQFQIAIYLWRKLTDAFDIKGPQDISAEIQLGLYKVTGLYSHPGHIRPFESVERVNYPGKDLVRYQLGGSNKDSRSINQPSAGKDTILSASMR